MDAVSRTRSFGMGVR